MKKGILLVMAAAMMIAACRQAEENTEDMEHVTLSLANNLSSNSCTTAASIW